MDGDLRGVEGKSTGKNCSFNKVINSSKIDKDETNNFKIVKIDNKNKNATKRGKKCQKLHDNMKKNINDFEYKNISDMHRKHK